MNTQLIATLKSKTAQPSTVQEFEKFFSALAREVVASEPVVKPTAGSDKFPRTLVSGFDGCVNVSLEGFQASVTHFCSFDSRKEVETPLTSGILPVVLHQNGAAYVATSFHVEGDSADVNTYVSTQGVEASFKSKSSIAIRNGEMWIRKDGALFGVERVYAAEPQHLLNRYLGLLEQNNVPYRCVLLRRPRSVDQKHEYLARLVKSWPSPSILKRSFEIPETTNPEWVEEPGKATFIFSKGRDCFPLELEYSKISKEIPVTVGKFPNECRVRRGRLCEVEMPAGEILTSRGSLVCNGGRLLLFPMTGEDLEYPENWMILEGAFVSLGDSSGPPVEIQQVKPEGSPLKEKPKEKDKTPSRPQSSSDQEKKKVVLKSGPAFATMRNVIIASETKVSEQVTKALALFLKESGNHYIFKDITAFTRCQVSAHAIRMKLRSEGARVFASVTDAFDGAQRLIPAKPEMKFRFGNQEVPFPKPASWAEVLEFYRDLDIVPAGQIVTDEGTDILVHSNVLRDEPYASVKGESKSLSDSKGKMKRLAQGAGQPPAAHAGSEARKEGDGQPGQDLSDDGGYTDGQEQESSHEAPDPNLGEGSEENLQPKED